MTLPNFLVIGAAKSGTFSLFNYLRQHPQIYMSPVKEPKYFAFSEGETLSFNGPGDLAANRRVTTDFGSYCKLFAGVNDEIAIGECSPSYLYSSQAPERIKNILPDVKIITILRNPVERAYSNFLHLFASGREPLNNFEQALKAEPERIKNNWEYFWYYKNQGFYYAKLKPYFEIFAPNQIKVYLYEDYQSDPMKLLKDIFTFLNVNSSFVPDVTKKYHVAEVPKSIAVHNLIARPNPVRLLSKTLLPPQWQKKIGRGLKKLNQTNTKPEIDPLIKHKLMKEYREDIIKLQDLIQQDLGNWLNG